MKKVDVEIGKTRTLLTLIQSPTFRDDNQRTVIVLGTGYGDSRGPGHPNILNNIFLLSPNVEQRKQSASSSIIFK